MFDHKEPTPKITSIRYWYSSAKPRTTPKRGDIKYFKGTSSRALKQGWYIREYERCGFGPGAGAMVVTKNGPRYNWVKMDPQPAAPPV